MAQITTGIRKILSNPLIYNFFKWSLGANKGTSNYVCQHVCPGPNDTLLDMGCGIADILQFLPDTVDYYGIDINNHYIQHAKQKFGTRGTFICNDINNGILSTFPKFDLIIFTALLHHLNDDEVTKLFKIASASLKEKGRLVTLDCCFTPNQSKLAKWIISKDRGQNVRTPEGYEVFAKQIFRQVKTTIRHDLLRIPYTHVIMECTLCL